MTRKPYQVRPAPLHLGRHSPKPGFCTHCGRLATREALFEGDGVIIVEKYCDACMEPEQFAALQTWYARIGKL